MLVRNKCSFIFNKRNILKIIYCEYNLKNPDFLFINIIFERTEKIVEEVFLKCFTVKFHFNYLLFIFYDCTSELCDIVSA